MRIPTVGIGAGPGCDAQIMVWQDLAGLTTGHVPRFVKRYAELDDVLTRAVADYVNEVAEGVYPPRSTPTPDRRRDVDQRFRADVADRVRGGGRDEHQRADHDLACLVSDEHLAPPAHDHVGLLLRPVAVHGLLAVRLALHPGDGIWEIPDTPV